MNFDRTNQICAIMFVYVLLKSDWSELSFVCVKVGMAYTTGDET